MNKYWRFLIYVVSFFIIAVADISIFSGFFSQPLADKYNWVLDNTILSLLIFFWMFIAFPALGAYYISFRLTKNKTESNNLTIDNPDIKPANSKQQKLIIITTIILAILITAFIRWGTTPRFLPYTFQEIQPGELNEITPTIFLPSTTPIEELISSTPTAIPAPTNVSLFPLNFGTIDYSKAYASGDVPGAKVKLYDINGHFLGEKIVPQIIVKENIGTGGNVQFDVPLGTYKAEAETDKLQGSAIVTIKSFSDIQYYSIYMKAKPIKISGKYFFDANKNGKYDEGETSFSNKKINAFVRTGMARELYTSGSTVTDGNGNFNLVGDYIGSYALGAEQVLGYLELPQRWVDLSGGESINYDIYLWPN